jgi:multiple sugar transport system ATP-binding protein
VASVRYEGVSKVFPKDVVALARLDLEIHDGEFLVLVGPSGCGKSTTLRILAGLEEPTTGRTFIADREVTRARPQDRDIAMVFQNYALYPHMSVFENMAFSLRMRRVPREVIRKSVDEAAAVLGITDYLERKPRELSGGQRQRVALGRAIVRHPAVFLFDEPLSNLDAKLRVQMRSELSRLHTRLGATMIYVTHDQAEAMTLGDRIVVLRDGHVQQTDSPLALYDAPANSFVAGFIGSPAMNFLPVSLDGGTMAAGDASITADRFAGMPAGDYLFGARPEDVHPDPDGALHGRVEVVETLGNEKIIYMSFAGRQFACRTSPKALASPGDELPFRIDIDRCHLFDGEGSRVVIPR